MSDFKETSTQIDITNARLGRLLESSLSTAVERLLTEWRKRTVLVLGFSGAGKTSLLRMMFGIEESAEDLAGPTTQVNEYFFSLNKTRFKAADTPGHPTLRRRLDAELDALVRGNYQGVINVVAYGFNRSMHHDHLEMLGAQIEPGDPRHLVGKQIGLEFLGNGQLVGQHPLFDGIQPVVSLLVLEKSHPLAVREPLLGLDPKEGHRRFVFLGR